MKKKAKIIGIVFLVILFPFFIFGRHSVLNIFYLRSIQRVILHAKNLPKVREMASRIKIGMNEAEVRKIFPDRDGGLGPQFYQDSSGNIKQGNQPYVVYVVSPDIKIRVPYDEQDKVNGPVEIYTQLPFSD